MKTPIRILFLCTGNSCRSIIVEALANQLGEGRLQAFSAGSHPSGTVNANALNVLARHGVAVSNPSSQSWHDYEQVEFDLVVTVCDAAASESCPVWLGDAIKAHWGVADPADVSGTQIEIEQAFEHTYTAMKARIEALLALTLDSISTAELRAAMANIQSQFSE